MGSYLGLPESLSGSKTKLFMFVQKQLQDRISKILIERGGKEVLIKSVAAVLPMYVMSCFRLPKTITSKLTSAITTFWWGASGGKKRNLLVQVEGNV